MEVKALVFAGQGSQFVGMGKDLTEAYPVCKELFDKADEVLGYKLSEICFEGNVEELTKSNHCQPAIFVTSIACYKSLNERAEGLNFAGTAGLSLGEWSSLHMAKALSFEDTVRILEARGRFMQEACEERDGAMVSIIGLTMDKLLDICSSTCVEIANLNSTSQTVLSGERKNIEHASEMANSLGAKRAIMLNVAGAFHSSLMNSAAERLEKFLADIKINQPEIPVLSNVTGTIHKSPDEIRHNMIKQVNNSVNWFSCIQWFMDNKISEYIECGPGKVLSGLIKRIDSNALLRNIQDCTTLDKVVEGINK